MRVNMRGLYSRTRNIAFAAIIAVSSLGAVVPMFFNNNQASALGGHNNVLSLTATPVCSNGLVNLVLTQTNTKVDSFIDTNAYVKDYTTAYGSDSRDNFHLWTTFQGHSNDFATVATNQFSIPAGSASADFATLSLFGGFKVVNYTANYPALNCDTVKPTVAFVDPGTPVAGLYQTGDFNVTWTAQDNDQLSSVIVALYDGNSHWDANCYVNQAETGTSDNGTCTVHLGNLPDGKYYIQVGAQDTAGNWSVNAVRELYVWRSAPQQPTGLYAKFQYDASTLTSGSTLNITAKPGGNNLELLWNAPTNDYVTGYHILANFPDNTTGLFYQGPNTNAWLAAYDGFGKHGEGRYDYQVVGVNSIGESVASQTFSLYYDHSIPTASFTSALPLYVNGNFQVSIKAHDNVGLKNVGVDVRTQNNPNAGANWVAGCTPVGPAIDFSLHLTDVSYTCTVNLSHVNDGTYTLRANAGDFAGYGNVNADKYWVFTLDTVPPTAPTITTANGSAFHKDFFVNYTPATDNASGIAHYEYYYVYTNKKGNTVTGSTHTTTSTHALAVTGTGNFEDGSTVTVELRAVDGAGNAGPWVSGSYLYDNTAPALSVNSNLASTNPTPALIAGTIDVADASLPVTVTVNGQDYTANVKADGTWSVTLASALTAGSYTVTVTATDAAGNAGTATGNLTVADPITTLSFISPTAIQSPQPDSSQTNGGAGVLGDQTDTPSTTTKDTAALPNNADKAVEGASTQKSAALAWYWWILIILAVAALAWGIVARIAASRNQQ